MTTNTITAIKATDEARFNTAVLPDAELALSLDASSAYWIEGVVRGNIATDYAHVINYYLSYDGALDDEFIHVALDQMPCGYSTSYTNVGVESSMRLQQSALASSKYIWNSTGSNSSTATFGVIWFRGRITTTDAGILTFDWGHAYNGYGPAYQGTVKAGSWIYATPLDICPL